MDELILAVRKTVLEQMDLTRDISDDELEEMVAHCVAKQSRGMPLSLKQRNDLQRQVFHSLRKLDVLQDLMDDSSITEIMVNGPSKIFYEREGTVYQTDRAFWSEEKLMDVIQQIVGKHNRVVNQSSPIVDTRLEDGSRVNIVLPPVAVDGAAVSIRKFPEKPFQMEELIQRETISEEAAKLLERLIQARYSCFISGGTSSGKTTFLNALSQYIPSHERIITIEDAAELQIQGIPNLVRLETRNSNVEGLQAVTMRELIRSALRMRPDRIVVGECRGAETLDMLQAMNTGHDGSMSTGHANSCSDMCHRLEMMVLMGIDLPMHAIRQQIVSGIDLMIQLGRLRDGSRRVLEIAEVEGLFQGEIQLHSLYRFEERGMKDGKVLGELVKLGELRKVQKLQMAGLGGSG